jgi:hypothetical protein
MNKTRISRSPTVLRRMVVDACQPIIAGYEFDDGAEDFVYDDNDAFRSTIAQCLAPAFGAATIADAVTVSEGILAAFNNSKKVRPEKAILIRASETFDRFAISADSASLRDVEARARMLTHFQMEEQDIYPVLAEAVHCDVHAICSGAGLKAGPDCLTRFADYDRVVARHGEGVLAQSEEADIAPAP